LSGIQQLDGWFRQAVKIAFCVQRGHTAGARRGNCLTVDVVHHVARGKHARDAGLGSIALDAGLHFDIAVFQL